MCAQRKRPPDLRLFPDGSKMRTLRAPSNTEHRREVVCSSAAHMPMKKKAKNRARQDSIFSAARARNSPQLKNSVLLKVEYARPESFVATGVDVRSAWPRQDLV